MKPGLLGTALSAIALLSACGGGGGGDSSSTPDPVAGAPTPTPAPAPVTTAGCSLNARAEWVGSQMREWYLFPETLPANLGLGGAANIDDYIDRLTATARSQRRDRFFTYLTSIQEENAFRATGSSAGFGIRLTTEGEPRRTFIAEAFEGAPALAAGLDRGTEILAIGATADSLQTIQQIVTARGDSGVTDALGASTPGLTRTLRVRDPGGAERTVTVSKAEYALTPLSSRYGVKIIEEGGRRYGYLNLRTFGISSADPALRDAFATFRTQGVTDLVVDFRYNGGGLVSIADLMGDLMGANRSTSDVFRTLAFRPEKAAEENETRRFRPQPQSIAPTRVAFIGTRATASASEEVINGMLPYLRSNQALVGANTFGKPVGQIALDRSACDDRLRVVAFAVQNADGQGDYFDGLATKVPVTCQAPDDVLRPLGDPQEGSTRAALDFLQGKTCTRIAEGGTITTQRARTARTLLEPERPTVAQREVPGLY